MCGRFTNTLGPEELTKQIGESLGLQIRESVSTDPWNVRPTDPVAALIAPTGEPQARMLRWGLLPPWTPEVNATKPMINARIEGLREKGSYANVEPDGQHRALVLADGFYEWEHPEDKKQKPQPYRFTVDGGRVFAFRGGVVNEHEDRRADRQLLDRHMRLGAEPAGQQGPRPDARDPHRPRGAVGVALPEHRRHRRAHAMPRTPGRQDVRRSPPARNPGQRRAAARAEHLAGRPAAGGCAAGFG